MIRAIAFDFDGVILESSEIKTRAFAALFEGYPEHVDRIVGLHLQRQGVSRFEKFRQIHREILQIPLSDSEEVQLGKRFSETVREELLSCPFVPGARDLLDGLSATYPLYVASGTPQDELRDVASHRAIAHYFTALYGAPRTKEEILTSVLEEQSLGPENLLFVGDATTDLEAAREIGTPFIARTRPETIDTFADAGVSCVSDLADLRERWTDLAADPPPAPAPVH